VTFDLVFGFFVLAMVAIAVLAVRWAVGRDRAEKRSREMAEPGTPPKDGSL
jgi:hypothetical protein